jgi:hypothetical protein
MTYLIFPAIVKASEEIHSGEFRIDDNPDEIQTGYPIFSEAHA